MKIIDLVISIFIKIIMILWGIISLLVLTFISIFIYLVFLIKVWFLKRKFNNYTKPVDATESHAESSTIRKNNIKSAETKESSKRIEIKTIKRELKTKDGEYR